MQKRLIKGVLIVGFFSLSFDAIAQADREIMLSASSAEEIEFVEERQERKFVQKINPFYWAYTGLVTFYQRNISVQIAANCIYEETCSRFSRKLVNEKGILGGMVLSLDRLARCNKVTLAETSPLRFNQQGKVIEHLHEYNF